MKRVSRRLRYCCFAVPGATAGVIGMALGVVLATPDIGWERALYYSIFGLIGAPLATLAWGTSKLRRAQNFAGVSLLMGIFGTMAILLEFTVQHAAIADALARSPFVFVGWLAVWVLWMSLALLKLVWFVPAYTGRQTLSR